jgi:hypothetical protein
VFGEEGYSFGDVVLAVGFEVPLDLGQFGLVEEAVGAVRGLCFAVEVVGLVGGGEVQQVFIDAQVDGVLFEDFDHGDVAFVGASKQFAEIAEGLLRLVVQGFVDLLEGFGEVQIVYTGAELEPDEVLVLEGLVGLEWLSGEDVLVQDDVEVGLQGLQQVVDVVVQEITRPDGGVEVLLAVGVQVVPETRGAVVVAKDHVQQVYYAQALAGISIPGAVALEQAALQFET